MQKEEQYFNQNFSAGGYTTGANKMRRIEFKAPNGQVIAISKQLEVGDEITVYIKKKEYEAEVLDIVVPTLKVGDTIYSGKFKADGSGYTGKYIWDGDKGITVDLQPDVHYHTLSWKKYTIVDGKTRVDSEKKYYLSQELAESDYQAIKATGAYKEDITKGIFGFDSKTLSLSDTVDVQETFELA